MTSIGLISITFFTAWAFIFLVHSLWIFHKNDIQNDDIYRTLWVINLGAGLGILLYNYEIESILQSHIANLPLSLSSLRVFIGNILISFPYYLALKKLNKISFSNRIFYLVWGHFGIVISIDLIANLFFTLNYREFQIWMSVVIIPFSFIAAITVMPIMKIILKDERNNANRARFLWWLIELTMTTLSAICYLTDAIYRILYTDYRLYTFGTILGLSFYGLLIISALCRVVFPQRMIEIILYPEKIWTYYRLRLLCKQLHEVVDLPEIYRYQEYFYPSLYNLDREICRSVISIGDVSRLLSNEHYIKKDLLALRNSQLSTQDAIEYLLKVKVYK